MPIHTCKRPGCAVRVAQPGQCPRHAAQAQRHRARTTPTKRTRDWTEINRRRAAVKAHVAEHGWTCPGYGRPSHPSHDLTADHVTAIARGGRPDGPLAVLCRECNGRKGAR
jgi:5-methylcytosine-specific restriction endonuclease McrA